MSQVLPKLNDLINANPGTKYLCIISGAGKRLEGREKPSGGFYSPSWMYIVVYNNEEYVYFANSESHMLDIERQRSMGKAVEIWMKETNEEEEHGAYMLKTYYAEGVELTKELKSMVEEKPDWDAIARRDKRHEYALEVFKYMHAKDECSLQVVNDKMKTLIDSWVEFSMTGEVPKKDGKTADVEPF